MFKQMVSFAPDTSTSNRSMIGNNSCGSYGANREHVKSIDVILNDNSEAIFEPLTTYL